MYLINTDRPVNIILCHKTGKMPSPRRQHFSRKNPAAEGNRAEKASAREKNQFTSSSTDSGASSRRWGLQQEIFQAFESAGKVIAVGDALVAGDAQIDIVALNAGGGAVRLAHLAPRAERNGAGHGCRNRQGADPRAGRRSCRDRASLRCRGTADIQPGARQPVKIIHQTENTHRHAQQNAGEAHERVGELFRGRSGKCRRGTSSVASVSLR